MSQDAFAANNVSDINVDVGIYDDGSAYITQTWNCDFSEGTECYIPIENLGEMSISNFMVSDENGPYTYSLSKRTAKPDTAFENALEIY